MNEEMSSSSSSSSTEGHQRAPGLSPKECSLCSNEYDVEIRCADFYNFSHHLCNACIGSLIRNSANVCLFCRRQLDTSSSHDVNCPNAFVRYFTELPTNLVQKAEINAREACTHEAVSRSMKITVLKDELVEVSTTLSTECRKAQRQNEMMMARVADLQKLISQENEQIKNEILSKMKVVISQNDKTLEDLRQKAGTYQNRNEAIKNEDKVLCEVNDELKTCAANRYEDIYKALDDAEDTNAAAGEWLKDLKKTLAEDEKTLEKDQKDIERDYEKIRNIHENLNLVLEHGEDVISKEESLGEILVAALQELTVPMKKLIEKRKIYAFKKDMGERRFAKLTLKDNHMFLHALTDDPAPSNALLLKYDDVIGISSQPPRLSVFELKRVSSGDCLGIMIIRIYSRPTEPSEFLHMCMGTVRPSFVNIKVKGTLHKDTPHECVEFGNWGGQVGKFLSLGFADYPNWLAGKVRGRGTFDEATMFEIFTQDNPHHYINCLGEVESGLRILKEAISNGYIDDIVVNDCGIVINFPESVNSDID